MYALGWGFLGAPLARASCQWVMVFCILAYMAWTGVCPFLLPVDDTYHLDGRAAFDWLLKLTPCGRCSHVGAAQETVRSAGTGGRWMRSRTGASSCSSPSRVLS
jgi:hypothetical protein